MYPTPSSILANVADVSVLRVGGFHQWDCVDKIAKAAFEKKIDILVDEDTTEPFLWSGKRGLSTPLIRTDEYLDVDEWDEVFIDLARDARKNKPWFARVREV